MTRVPSMTNYRTFMHRRPSTAHSVPQLTCSLCATVHMALAFAQVLSGKALCNARSQPAWAVTWCRTVAADPGSGTCLSLLSLRRIETGLNVWQRTDWFPRLSSIRCKNKAMTAAINAGQRDVRVMSGKGLTPRMNIWRNSRKAGVGASRKASLTR